MTPPQSSNTGCIARARAGSTARAPRHAGGRCHSCGTSADPAHPADSLSSASSGRQRASGLRRRLQHVPRLPLVDDDLIARRESFAAETSRQDDRAVHERHHVGRVRAAARPAASSAASISTTIARAPLAIDRRRSGCAGDAVHRAPVHAHGHPGAPSGLAQFQRRRAPAGRPSPSRRVAGVSGNVVAWRSESPFSFQRHDRTR